MSDSKDLAKNSDFTISLAEIASFSTGWEGKRDWMAAERGLDGEGMLDRDGTEGRLIVCPRKHDVISSPNLILCFVERRFVTMCP